MNKIKTISILIVMFIIISCSKENDKLTTPAPPAKEEKKIDNITPGAPPLSMRIKIDKIIFHPLTSSGKFSQVHAQVIKVLDGSFNEKVAIFMIDNDKIKEFRVSDECILTKGTSIVNSGIILRKPQQTD